jgi:tetratricopeptide (TPR) repeat protein
VSVLDLDLLEYKITNYYESLVRASRIDLVNRRFIVQEFAKCRGNTLDLKALFNIGQFLLLDLGWNEDALVVLEAASELDPENPLLHQRLAEVHKQIGNYQSALELYKRLTILFPQNPEYWGCLAFEQYRLGLDKDALTNFQRAIELEPDFLKNRDADPEHREAFDTIRRKGI